MSELERPQGYDSHYASTDSVVLRAFRIDGYGIPSDITDEEFGLLQVAWDSQHSSSYRLFMNREPDLKSRRTVLFAIRTWNGQAPERSVSSDYHTRIAREDYDKIWQFCAGFLASRRTVKVKRGRR